MSTLCCVDTTNMVALVCFFARLRGDDTHSVTPVLSFVHLLLEPLGRSER